MHWGGGRVSKGLADVTHLVVLEVPGLITDLHPLTEWYVLEVLKQFFRNFWGSRRILVGMASCSHPNVSVLCS